MEVNNNHFFFCYMFAKSFFLTIPTALWNFKQERIILIIKNLWYTNKTNAFEKNDF